MRRSIITKFTSMRTIKCTAIIGYLVATSLVATAEIYSTKQKGNYDQKEIWAPKYPGNVIKESDTIVISQDVKHNIDVVVKGTVIIQENGSLNGDNKLIIIKSGTLFNLGTSKFGALTNRGAIYNQNNLEVLIGFREFRKRYQL